MITNYDTTIDITKEFIVGDKVFAYSTRSGESVTGRVKEIYPLFNEVIYRVGPGASLFKKDDLHFISRPRRSVGVSISKMYTRRTLSGSIDKSMTFKKFAISKYKEWILLKPNKKKISFRNFLKNTLGQNNLP